ncbi:hypothetical protein E2320_012235, partial [Naja naja]
MTHALPPKTNKSIKNPLTKNPGLLPRVYYPSNTQPQLGRDANLFVTLILSISQFYYYYYYYCYYFERCGKFYQVKLQTGVFKPGFASNHNDVTSFFQSSPPDTRPQKTTHFLNFTGVSMEGG